MDKKKMIKAMLFTPWLKGKWGAPINLEGPPGTAKTGMVETIAAECGLHAETILASVRRPEDFGGVPYPSSERPGYFDRLADMWVARVNQAGRAVAFFDEGNTADQDVMKALLRVLLDRVSGDKELAPTVRIMWAQNRTEEAVDGHDLPAPLANRLLHMTWDGPSFDEWSEWLLSGGADAHPARQFDPAKEEQRVLAAWDEPFARAKGLVTGFIHRMPGELHQQPPVGDPRASKAWASRRTWEMATRTLAGAEAHALSEEETGTLLAGCVGEAAAIKFLTYVTEVDLPNIPDFLDGKITWKPDARLDRTMAVLSSCAAYVMPTTIERRKERVEKLWEVLLENSKVAADVVLPSMRTLLNGGLAKGVPAAAKTLEILHPVFAVAGLLP